MAAIGQIITEKGHPTIICFQVRLMSLTLEAGPIPMVALRSCSCRGNCALPGQVLQRLAPISCARAGLHGARWHACQAMGRADRALMAYACRK